MKRRATKKPLASGFFKHKRSEYKLHSYLFPQFGKDLLCCAIYVFVRGADNVFNTLPRVSGKPSKISSDAWETFKRKAKETIAVNLAKDLVCGENPDSTSNSPAWNLLPYFEKVELQKLQEGRVAATNVNEKSRSVELLNERLNIREQELKMRELELSQNEIANTAHEKKSIDNLQ